MMKNIFVFLASAFVLFCSCEKPDTEITVDTPKFSGEMTVVYEGEDFDQPGVQVQVAFNDEKTAVDIKLLKVKFVPAMPIRIDVTIMDVPVMEMTDGGWTFSADGITPWALGGPYDTYRVDDLHGSLTEETLEFSLGFYNTKKQQNYPTAYSGSM